MNIRVRSAAVLVPLLLLQACAQPIGPTISVLPGPGKPFAAFQADQHDCSILAGQTIKPMLDNAGANALGTAVIGTALGAGLGAAVGGGRGAGIGAAGGAIAGGAVGSDQMDAATNRIQSVYDSTYGSCMYSRGDQVQAPAQTVVIPAPYMVQPAPVVVPSAPYVSQPQS